MVRQFFRKNLFKIDNKPVWPSFRTRWSRWSPWNRARSIGRAHRFLPHRSWLFIAGCRLWNLANVSIQRPLSLLLPPAFLEQTSSSYIPFPFLFFFFFFSPPLVLYARNLSPTARFISPRPGKFTGEFSLKSPLAKTIRENLDNRVIA